MALPKDQLVEWRPRRSATTTPSFVVETRAGTGWTVGSEPPQFTVRVPDRASWDRLLRANPYAAAKAFVDGGFDVDGDLIAAIRWWRARAASRRSWLIEAALRWSPESWLQSRTRARRDIEFHYDRSNQFYQQFLDRQMVYSSAYFVHPSMSLEQAQSAKLDHVLRKLEISGGDRFLDVGCGWGALVMRAAQRGVATAVGCTLSTRQFEFATDAVRRSGLGGVVRIYKLDYRGLRERFDKIASIGMYEHVGRHRLGEYFRTLAALMAPDALLLNSGIARPEGVADDGATLFLRRFVFPGGEIPYLGDVVRAAERAGLEVIGVENERQHYALTCARWVERLQAHRDACLAIVDARTYRTWLLYLAASVVSFERGESELYQILFAKRAFLVVR